MLHCEEENHEMRVVETDHHFSGGGDLAPLRWFEGGLELYQESTATSERAELLGDAAVFIDR
jgi:hypothetical protein